MAKIYISSTYEDLKDLRRVATKVVRKLGHEAVAMEGYSASAEQPLEKCLKDVRECDGFIGIFAWRYGTIPDGHEKSITHLEYEEACKQKIPCLIFLLDPSALWQTDLVSVGEEREKIDALRTHLQKTHIVKLFSSPEELSIQVKAALDNQFPGKRTFPSHRLNWIRRLALGLTIATAAYVVATMAVPSKLDLQTKEEPVIESPRSGDPPGSSIKTEPVKEAEKKEGDIKENQINEVPPQDPKPTPLKKPEFVEEIETKGALVKKNAKGFWEAEIRDGIVLIYIPPGEFIMGSDESSNEKPVHKVYLGGYWIGKTEVTIGQYMKFVNETRTHYPAWGEPGGEYNIETGTKDGYKRMGESLTGDHYPIVGISWDDAVAYCDWLSEQTGMKIVLPGEAQWEKASRGIDSRVYPWGNGKVTGRLANIADKKFASKFPEYDWADKTIDDGYIYTSPVGTFPDGSSPFGAMDMAGNVWEWCQDWYSKDYYRNSPGKNPVGPDSGDYRVLRGGSWFNTSDICRCAYRSHDRPAHRVINTGFRLARSL